MFAKSWAVLALALLFVAAPFASAQTFTYQTMPDGSQRLTAIDGVPVAYRATTVTVVEPPPPVLVPAQTVFVQVPVRERRRFGLSINIGIGR